MRVDSKRDTSETPTNHVLPSRTANRTHERYREKDMTIVQQLQLKQHHGASDGGN